MVHSPGFLKVVDEARGRIREVTIEDARKTLSQDTQAILVDVREDDEWKEGHAADAIHLGKGILERDLERIVPDANRTLILYCGGGYRSILAADMARKMGYKNACSLMTGYKGMVASHWPMTKS